MTLLSILDRFRPAGAPGSAGVVGVPSVDDRGPAVELAPVFAALEQDVVACADLVERARRDARSLLADARDRSAALLARARLDADVARSRAAAAVQHESSSSDEQLRAAALEQVARLAEVGRARVADLAPRLAATLLDAPGGGQP